MIHLQSCEWTCQLSIRMRQPGSLCLQDSQESDTRANSVWLTGEVLSCLKGSEVDERWNEHWRVQWRGLDVCISSSISCTVVESTPVAALVGILELSSAAFSFLPSQREAAGLQSVCSETHRQSGRCGGRSCRMTCSALGIVDRLLKSPSSPESPPPPTAAPLIPHRAGCWENMIHSRLRHDIPTKSAESAEETTTGSITSGCSISATTCPHRAAR